MQTPDRYWEGLFWDGFAPESIGAVPLSTAKPKPNDPKLAAHTQSILDAVCQKLLSSSSAPPTTTSGDQKQTPSPVPPPPPKPSEFYITIFQSGVGANNQWTVRCWHESVFKGARLAGVGNPGSLNRDFHFERISGKFVRATTIDETEAEFERTGTNPYAMTEHLLVRPQPVATTTAATATAPASNAPTATSVTTTASSDKTPPTATASTDLKSTK